MTDKARQLERLLSEHLDGDLDADQLAELRRALAEDPRAAATARQYARLDALLAGWRVLPMGVDWQAFEREAAARVSEDAEPAGLATGRSDAGAEDESVLAAAGSPPTRPVADHAAVDRLIRSWAGPLPEVDWDDLTSRISAAIRREAVPCASVARETAPRRRWRRTAAWMVGVGVPLAAAAVIAIAVWWPKTHGPIAPGETGSAGPWVFVSLEAPGPAGEVSVVFEEGPAVEASGADSRGGVAIAIVPGGAGDLEPIDEALFY